MESFIGQLLVREGIITEVQLDQALWLQLSEGGRLGSILMELGHLTERDFLRWLGARLGIRHVVFEGHVPDAAVANLVSGEVAQRARAIPVRLAGETLVVASADPTDAEARAMLRNATGLQVDVWLTSDLAVSDLLAKLYGIADVREPPVSASPAAAESFHRFIAKCVAEARRVSAQRLVLDSRGAVTLVEAWSGGERLEVARVPAALSNKILATVAATSSPEWTVSPDSTFQHVVLQLHSPP